MVHFSYQILYSLALSVMFFFSFYVILRRITDLLGRFFSSCLVPLCQSVQIFELLYNPVYLQFHFCSLFIHFRGFVFFFIFCFDCCRKFRSLLYNQQAGSVRICVLGGGGGVQRKYNIMIQRGPRIPKTKRSLL